MEKKTIDIQCANPDCLAPNSRDSQICQECYTPLIDRYLFSLGNDLSAYEIGSLIGDRYLLSANRLLLDTKPGMLPQLTDRLPEFIIPYLKLLPYRLHIPQVYGLCVLPEKQEEIWLLEYPRVIQSGEKTPELLPGIEVAWTQATAMRQLNWLWQIAKLWQPMQEEKVVSSLLNPNLLQVNGSWLRLLELQADADETPKLKQLGELWSQWAATSSPQIKSFLTKLSLALEEQTVSSLEQLQIILERAIQKYGQTQQCHYEIVTRTDAGPTRENNEDACYPHSGSFWESKAEDNPVAIVCDGIGGHEGGEIASQMAIDYLVDRLQQIKFSSQEWKSSEILAELRELANNTNDLISDRNDREGRYEPRQRMGTTIVATLAHKHEIYTLHVGDSRIYWLDRNNCQQITVDDDLASREVCNGYYLYRDALQYPAGGALTQALGMSTSAYLHPNLQHFIIDEDCLFLLCSDGLSDFDRVEQHWSKVLLPGLEEQKKPIQIVEEIMAIANYRNGHDNATVALVRCRVKPSDRAEEITLTEEDFQDFLVGFNNNKIEVFTETTPLEEKDRENEEKYVEMVAERKLNLFSLLNAVLLTIVGLAAIIVAKYFYLSTPAKNNNLQIGNLLTIEQDISLISDPASEISENNSSQIVPAGSILKILAAEETANSEWVRLQLCQLPPESPALLENPDSEAELPPLPPSNEGWIQTEKIAQVVVEDEITPDSQPSSCISATN